MENISALQKDGFPVFKDIYEAYHYRLYNYVFARTNSEYISEEVVQLTFIKVWEKRMKLSREISLASQIFRIANTTLIDLIRKLENKNKLSVFSKNATAYRADEVLPRLFLKETQQKLDLLIDSLPPIRARVFRMSRFEELSHKEISDELKISKKTVESHIYLALKFIRPFFSQLFEVWVVFQIILLA